MSNQLSKEPGRAVAAFVLIGLGLLFLFGQMFSFNWFGFIWPFFIIVPGLVFLYFAFTGSKGAAGLAVPGAIVTGTGAILLFQSITDKWESWAYIWTLYPVFLGLGLMFIGQRSDDPNTYRTGRGFVTWGVVGFLIFGAFFELFIFGGFGALGGYLVPVLLIALGGWMLLRSSGTLPARRREPRRKRFVDDEPSVFTGAPVVGRRPDYAPRASDRLRQEIDAALAEDDEPVAEERADEAVPVAEPVGDSPEEDGPENPDDEDDTGA